MPHSPDNMTFGDHLDELRKRVILALIVPIPILIACLIFGGPLLSFIVQPLVNALESAGATPTLIATSPLETFAAYMKVGFIVTLLLAFPWILYQLWLFVAPGLYAQERRFVYFFIPLSAILTALASTFLYYILLPVSLVFLIGFGQSIIQRDSPTAAITDTIAPLTIPLLPGTPEAPPPGFMWFDTETQSLSIAIDDNTIMRRPFARGSGVVNQDYRIGEYVSLFFSLALAFTIAFQLPIVLLILSWVDIVRAQSLARARRYVIFACAIGGAVFTPQDPLSMLLLAGAMYILFEFALILMRFATPDAIRGKASADKQSNTKPNDPTTFDADE
ncbi:MAG: twin-arginine translocase subunit TatC [Phycisphaerales bacterium]